MLNQDEELWEKHLPPMVEGLLASAKDPLSDRSDRSKTPAEGQVKPRDKTRVISFRVPHNAAVQIYDYKEKKARSARAHEYYSRYKLVV
jgi:major vault protein